MRFTKSASFTVLQRKTWRENNLAGSDEDIAGKFDKHLIGQFGPYVMRYRTATLTSIVLMLLYTVANLANPYLIGLAIDQYISHSALGGLALIGVILLVVNIIMWQAQYWQFWTM